MTAVGATAEHVLVAHRPFNDPDSSPKHPPTVRALSPADGTEQWRVELPNISYKLAIADDTVYAATEIGPLVAIR